MKTFRDPLCAHQSSKAPDPIPATGALSNASTASPQNCQRPLELNSPPPIVSVPVAVVGRRRLLEIAEAVGGVRADHADHRGETGRHGEPDGDPPGYPKRRSPPVQQPGACARQQGHGHRHRGHRVAVGPPRPVEDRVGQRAQLLGDEDEGDAPGESDRDAEELARP